MTAVFGMGLCVTWALQHLYAAWTTREHPETAKETP